MALRKGLVEQYWTLKRNCLRGSQRLKFDIVFHDCHLVGKSFRLFNYWCACAHTQPCITLLGLNHDIKSEADRHKLINGQPSSGSVMIYCPREHTRYWSVLAHEPLTHVSGSGPLML